MDVAVVNRGLTFDPSRLFEDARYLMGGGKLTTVNLRKRHDMPYDQAKVYGLTTLYDHEIGKYVIEQSEYDTLIDGVHGMYIASVIGVVQKYAATLGLKIGRARLITLLPKQCLTYHTDKESTLRFHIPIVTNDNVMYIVDDIVHRMPDIGQLYTLEVSKKHTVLNASRSMRLHIVLDGYV